MFTIKNYKDLGTWTESFSRGQFGLLILVGSPGLSKSVTVKKNMVNHNNFLYVKSGQLTAFQFYKQLYLYRNEHVVIDDIESALRDRQLVRLLKNLTETESERTISWTSASRQLISEGIPLSFQTTSRVMVIVNELETIGEHIESLLDRGHILKFTPPVREVFNYGLRFSKDKEINDFLEKQVDYLKKFSLRVFVKAKESKQAGVDWQSEALQTLGIYEIRLVESLLKNKNFSSSEAKITEFMRVTGLSRPMYHKYWQELNEILESMGKLGVPKRKVRGNTIRRKSYAIA